MASADRIPPGGSGEIKATLRTKGKKNHLRKSITVTMNDPNNGSFAYTMEGNVLVPYDVSPSYLNLQTVLVGQSGTAEVTVTNRTENTLVLGEPSVPYKELTISLSKTEMRPGESITVSGTFQPTDLARTTLSAYITIPIIEGKKGDLRIKVFGRIEGIKGVEDTKPPKESKESSR